MKAYAAAPCQKYTGKKGFSITLTKLNLVVLSKFNKYGKVYSVLEYTYFPCV
jgi:hypothetical protein